MKIEAIVLEDRFVRLEPLTEALREPMRQALDFDPEAWGRMVGSGYGERFDGFFSSAFADMAKGTKVAWAVRRRSDGVPGRDDQPV